MRRTRSQVHASILCPTDFQEPALRAFSYGLHLAGVLGAGMDILHVIKTVHEAGAPGPGRRSVHSLTTAALLRLGRLARLAQEAGIRAEPRLQYGVPETGILDALERVRPAAIVMGTEGRTGWDRLRLGSTAQAVISRASCPVLAVHGGLARDTVRHPARVTLDRWLIGTDFSPGSTEATETVSLLAGLLKATVSVVHVIEQPESMRSQQRRMNRLLQELRGNGVEAEGVCLSGDPVEIIVRQAGEWQADVIAVGTRGRRGLARLVLGSVAEGVLRRAGCPVLVVKHAAPLLRAGSLDKGGLRKR